MMMFKETTLDGSFGEVHAFVHYRNTGKKATTYLFFLLVSVANRHFGMLILFCLTMHGKENAEVLDDSQTNEQRNIHDVAHSSTENVHQKAAFVVPLFYCLKSLF